MSDTILTTEGKVINFTFEKSEELDVPNRQKALDQLIKVNLPVANNAITNYVKITKKDQEIPGVIDLSLSVRFKGIEVDFDN